MAKSTSYTLYVNLSASKVRKRLKGHGFGVTDIQASDRNQALIIHTATGDHLRDLQALFSDVASSSSSDELQTPLENLPNFGPTSSAWLREIGIHSIADLKKTGPVLAYHLVKQKRPTASLNLLWAIVAVVQGKEISELTESEKANLRYEVGE